ncbi:hypothetical protein GCM10023328_18080 [Modestobacter marinus]|uniref:Uncharacterized protein (TIGR02588 family) n=1 Tax=Modestobacter marinus TaxID=477641 RepID=A0A846LKK6_9ACTN|nr:hypothetical protein [Modestobacter marinus]NIH68136.1 uncharacterized protein (TIGR02588 family) [Modestobacter marinus]GGL80027.1 hypothetical protein GCM10011589_40340 [Modestobacter marinus]
MSGGGDRDETGGGAGGDGNGHGGGDRDTSRNEYLLGAVGALVILLVLAFLGYQAVVVRDGVPRLEVTAAVAERVGEGWVVPVEVVNEGGQTVEQVHVTGVLSRDGEEVQQATATFAYLAPSSEQSGALLFSEDPTDGTLEIRPAAYTLP